jgi:hypothetical protein
MGHGRRVAGRVIRVQSLSNKPLQRMWSPQGHRVESRSRLGGAHTAERQTVRQTSPPVIDVAVLEAGNALSKANGVILRTSPGSSQEIVEGSGEGAQVEMREYRLASYCALVLGVGFTLASSRTLAQEPPRRIDVGLAVRYMPTGWFEWSGRSGTCQRE